MRLRHAVAAAGAAFALALTLPGSSYAYGESFVYHYSNGDYRVQQSQLADPPSATCINLPEVEYKPGTYAFGPQNDTDSTVTVFRDENCDGEFYTLKPGGKASNRLLMKSVVFS